METQTETKEEFDKRLSENQDVIAQAKAHSKWFIEGEIIPIRGYSFRVKSVKPDEIRLKLTRYSPVPQ